MTRIGMGVPVQWPERVEHLQIVAAQVMRRGVDRGRISRYVQS